MKWESRKLEELCISIKSGGTPSTKKPEYYGGNIPWVKTKEVNFNKIYDTEEKITEDALANSSAKMIPERSVLVAMYGNGDTAGRCAMNMIPVSTNQACCNFTFNENVAHPEFMYYLISNHYKDFVHLKSGGAQLNLNGKTLKEFIVNIPPLPTQRRIASILSAYDDLIENNLRRIKLLEEAAQHIYREWFVRMRFPGWEGAKLGEDGLPEGWYQDTIGNYCDVTGGGTPSTSEPRYWEGGDILWFSPTDLSKNSSLVLIDSTKKITAEGLQNSSARLIPERTILMSSRATIGLFGLISQPCCTNQGFINIMPKQDWQRFYLLFNLMDRKKEIEGNASGTTFKEISKKDFRNMGIVVPKENIVMKFNSLTESIIDQIENLAIQNTRLKEARDILLPRLMNQTIEV